MATKEKTNAKIDTPVYKQIKQMQLDIDGRNLSDTITKLIAFYRANHVLSN